MKRAVLFASLLPLLAAGSPSPEGPSALLLTGARVLDREGDRWLYDRQVLVVGDRISKIGLPGEIAAPEGAQRLDLTGLFLLPGLMDLHTHLLLHPYDETPWNDQVLKESLELRTIRAVTAARATLEAGFTTIRDLGTEGAGFADVALRDAIDREMVPGPRVVAVTRAIVASASYGPSGFDRRWDIPQGAQEATGVDGVRRAVREQIAGGADWIKVYADYNRANGHPPTPTFSQEELNALVDEARSAGLHVVAHAATSEGIRRAVLAGAATIEHGYQASAEVLALMRERGVALCPTLAASEAVARYDGWKPGQAEPQALRDSREMFARARKSGVTIACGSDAGVFRHGNNAREIELMAAYGMTPAEALRAATSVAARVLGREKDLGRIENGYLADLIALRGDPLKDPTALREPIVVIRMGGVAVDRRATP